MSLLPAAKRSKPAGRKPTASTKKDDDMVPQSKGMERRLMNEIERVDKRIDELIKAVRVLSYPLIEKGDVGADTFLKILERLKK
nr:MAG: hypothetical protein [Helarchaeota virus Nidhogg Meg22_1012]URC17325.1 MAG: hypothetical protein [Helarchaeota virus Nidhogg Meg22_1214]